MIDKRPKGIVKGQADGIQARNLDISESFGFVDQVERKCNMSIEMCFWVGHHTTTRREKAFRETRAKVIRVLVSPMME